MLFENDPEYLDWKYFVDKTCREGDLCLRDDSGWSAGSELPYDAFQRGEWKTTYRAIFYPSHICGVIELAAITGRQQLERQPYVHAVATNGIMAYRAMVNTRTTTRTSLQRRRDRKPAHSTAPRWQSVACLRFHNTFEG